jgi:hypothetical protein
MCNTKQKYLHIKWRAYYTNEKKMTQKQLWFYYDFFTIRYTGTLFLIIINYEEFVLSNNYYYYQFPVFKIISLLYYVIHDNNNINKLK